MPRHRRFQSTHAKVAAPGLISFEVLESRRLLHAGEELGEPYWLSAFLTSSAEAALPLSSGELHPLSSIPVLNSNPDAPVSFYLDFDGHFEPIFGLFSDVTTPVYSRDADLGTFSDSELQAMHEIWTLVSEDFSPFNINVTTVEPPSFENGVALRVSIGGAGAWYGEPSSGFTYINMFSNSVVNTAYVFSANLGNGDPKLLGESTSHVIGHALGLYDQSIYDSSGKLIELHNPGANGLAPIMGNSFAATRGTWWIGPNSQGPGYSQWDAGFITRPVNGITYRTDDHGGTPNTATPLSGSGGTLTADGVIITTTDWDYFSFQTAGGRITLTVTVPQHNNLNARLELRTASDQVIAFASPADSFGAQLSLDLVAGSYLAVVRPEGTTGEVGQYKLVVDVFASSIEGDVFVDSDRDGVRDVGEAGIGGATVFDDRNGNQLWDAEPQFVLSAMDTPIAIPQSGAALVDIQLSYMSGTIVDLNVRVALSHPSPGNLALMIIAPSQIAVSLVEGFPLAGESLAGTVFDDAASESIYDGIAPYTGNFRAIGELSTFKGMSPNGRWRLLVADTTGADAGVIENFELEMTVSEPEPRTTTDAAGHYVFSYAAAGIHRIRQITVPGYTIGSPSGAVHELVIDADATYGGLDFANVLPSTVVGRALFYDGSKYDGGTAGINVDDDSAIATDKSAYLAGTGTATFANISSYSRGLNGIMIDIANLGTSLSLDDFQFRVGQDNHPAGWLPAPLPVAVTVRPGAGVSGSDRVELVWGDDAVKNAWLEVTLEGNDARGQFNLATGLAVSDTFYFGSRVGDTGSGTAVAAVTSAADELAARYNSATNVPITNVYDFDRSRTVSAADQLIARFNGGVLLKINLDAPQGSEALAYAVASALAISEDREVVAIDTPAVEPRRDVEKPAFPLTSAHRQFTV